MTYRLGLTGSIGMGKSTTAAMFADEGCAVWDADAAVHRLYSEGGAAVEPLQEAFPDAVSNGEVSRDALKRIIASDPAAMRRIEDIVHPLTARDREEFGRNVDADIAVFDIPLLFETGAHHTMDAVACVTIPPDMQRARVMERGTMTEYQFEQIREMQMPNDEKLALADHVIVTDTLEHARAQVVAIVRQIREGMHRDA